MALNQHASNLVDITLKAFNGDVTSVSLIDSISLIDSWISVLKSDDQTTNAIADSLLNLREELKRSTPNGEHVERIMKSLIDQTKQIARSTDKDVQPKLKTLSTSLQEFNQQVTGKSKRANSGGQAPISSTVGGESTSSGAGASALDQTDDDLANRNGGTTSSGPTVNMDDTTHSSGGSTNGNASAGADNTGDSQRSSQADSSDARPSRSDTSRVDGGGISGGTGDSDTAQSGGRSQY